MDFTTFKHSLAAKAPPRALSHAARALWWDAKGDWDKAHASAQKGEAKAGDRVAKGQHLADVRGWDGVVLQRIEAPFDGIVEITVNWLPVRSGEYALAMVKPVRQLGGS